MMIGTGLISLSIIFYGHRVIKGVDGLRRDFNEYRIHMEHRLSVVEVKQNEVHRNIASARIK